MVDVSRDRSNYPVKVARRKPTIMSFDPPYSAQSKLKIQCIVKFYDVEKEFGFATADGLDGDIMLHKSLLLSHGTTSIGSDAVLIADILQTKSGLRATKIHSITPPTPKHPERTQASDIDSDAIPARVKWFDHTKKYGFVNAFGSSEDIFIGIDALTRSGLSSVETGEAVSIQTETIDGRLRTWRVLSWNEGAGN